MCTKFGVRPAKSLEDLEDPRYLEENASVLRNVRNPVRRGQDDQELQMLRMQREERGRHIEELKQQLEEKLEQARQEEQYLSQLYSQQ